MSKRTVARNNTNDPLVGVLACLTGMDQREKDKLHGMIQKLGGSYTRDFDPAQNTHLIAKEASGAKFEVAVEFPKISIVSPEWIQVAWREQRRVGEAEYSLLNSGPDADTKESTRNGKTLDSGDDSKSNRQFISYHFFLFGWQDDEEELQQVALAIRKSWGTIHWELDFGRVTHVVVKDHSIDERTRNAALSRPSGPVFVSPSWVFSTLREGTSADPRQHLPIASKKKSAMFESCAFSINIEPQGGKDYVEFDEQKVEKIVTACGGVVISSSQLTAPSQKAKVVYSVRYGGSALNDSEAQEVTPLWLLTCEAEGKLVDPQLLPEIFVVKADVWYKFSKKGIKVSITGFEGPVRTALTSLIRYMGGTFHDSLRTNTTHLICGKPSGPKYEKAVQSNVHVVSSAWLFAVLQSGEADESMHSIKSKE